MTCTFTVHARPNVKTILQRLTLPTICLQEKEKSIISTQLLLRQNIEQFDVGGHIGPRHFVGHHCNESFVQTFHRKHPVNGGQVPLYTQMNCCELEQMSVGDLCEIHWGHTRLMQRLFRTYRHP